MESKLLCLISLVLQEIRVIEDYLQLLFVGGIILNIYNVYAYDGQTLSLLKGQQVTEVSESVESAVLSFSNRTHLIIGLKDDDYNGPEAMELIREGEAPVVWS